MSMRIQLWLIAMLWSLGGVAQTTEITAGPTTEEEYNYGSTGYKLQLQMELPMKKGYVLADLIKVEQTDRMVEFKSLIRKGEKKPCAILMIYSRQRQSPQYFCVPSPDAPRELWDKFYLSLNSDIENERDVFRMFSYSMAKLSATLAQE